MLIRAARLWPDGDAPVDVRTAGGTITEVGPGLRRAPADEEVIDAEGRALLPGLHDHHVHLRALAATRTSVRTGPPEVRTAADLENAVKTADAAASPGAWLRCTGYHESVAGSLDRYALDRLLSGRRPVRVQHRTGALWIVNSAAVSALRLHDCDLPGVERDPDGTPTGRLWRLDDWLAARLPSAPPDLASVSRAAAALGVTGFTDATPGPSRSTADALSGAAASGTIVQRLHLMAPPQVIPLTPARVTLGPVKIMLDDDTLPALDELTDQVRRAHAVNRPVAVHCVTRVQLILTLTALGEAGRHSGDRIEHGAVIGAETIPALRGLTIVTQPHFIAERGEQYATDVEPGDLPDLWRLGSLIDAGLKVAAGSDAPFGGADPWKIAATAGQPRFARTDRPVSPVTALSLFFGTPKAPATARRIAPGQPADLVLLRVPPAGAAARLAAGDTGNLVAATFVGGRQVFLGDTAPGRHATIQSRCSWRAATAGRRGFVPSVTWDWEIAELSRRLELELTADGTPVNPLVPVDLDLWRDAGPTAVAAAAGVIASALPVTAGMLSGPRSPGLAPLLDAVSLTVTDTPASTGRRIVSRNPPGREVIGVGDLPGEASLDTAVGRLREAAERSPRAAVACGRLVRQTAVLDTAGGLAAEAAAYSMLLGGPEFRRWRASRGEPRRVDPGPEPVLAGRSGNRLVITLNVPERRNAFSAAVREALLEALALAEADPSVTSVELRGAGPSFCAGGDLAEFGLADDLVAAYLVRMARAPWRVIDRIARKVTVFAHGACVGAGTEMLACAGRVVAAPDAFFQLPEVAMGLVPGAGGSVSVTRRIGRHRAAWLMLTGDRLPAGTARAWGLVDEILPAD